MLHKAIQTICSEYNISEQVLPTSARTGAISECRSMICYVLIWKMRISEVEVGVILGRTPKNCLYLLERARDRITSYASELERFERVIFKINSSGRAL